MIAFVKGFLSSMLCYWVSTFNPLHLPHFANEEVKARKHEVKCSRAKKRQGQDSDPALIPKSRLLSILPVVTTPLYCPENVQISQGQTGEDLGHISCFQHFFLEISAG